MKAIGLKAAIGQRTQIGTSEFDISMSVEDVPHRQGHSGEISPESIGIRFHAQSQSSFNGSGLTSHQYGTSDSTHFVVRTVPGCGCSVLCIGTAHVLQCRARRSKLLVIYRLQGQWSSFTPSKSTQMRDGDSINEGRDEGGGPRTNLNGQAQKRQMTQVIPPARASNSARCRPPSQSDRTSTHPTQFFISSARPTMPWVEPLPRGRTCRACYQRACTDVHLRPATKVIPSSVQQSADPRPSRKLSPESSPLSPLQEETVAMKNLPQQLRPQDRRPNPCCAHGEIHPWGCEQCFMSREEIAAQRRYRQPSLGKKKILFVDDEDVSCSGG